MDVQPEAMLKNWASLQGNNSEYEKSSRTLNKILHRIRCRGKEGAYIRDHYQSMYDREERRTHIGTLSRFGEWNRG